MFFIDWMNQLESKSRIGNKTNNRSCKKDAVTTKFSVSITDSLKEIYQYR